MAQKLRYDPVDRLTSILLIIALVLLLLVPIPYYISYPMSFLKVIAQTHIPQKPRESGESSSKKNEENIEKFLILNILKESTTASTSVLPFYFK